MPQWNNGKHGCTGKVAFDSAVLAHTVMQRGTRTHAPRGVYRCGHCGLFHLATAIKKIQPERKRAERQRYSTTAARASMAVADDFDDLT